MKTTDDRVRMNVLIDPSIRDCARESARLAGVEFSKWVEEAIRQAMVQASIARCMEKLDRRERAKED